MAWFPRIGFVLLPILLTLSAAEPLASNMRVEYFHNVNLTCEIKKDHEANNTIAAWLLPSGAIINNTKDGRIDNHMHLYNEGSFLEVRKVDDEDFGIYFCIYKGKNGNVGVFKTGINIDGPYYGEMINGYKRKAVIGGIVSGVVFGLIVVTCLLCSVCKHKGKSDIEQGLVDDYVNAKDTGTRMESVGNNSKPDEEANGDLAQIGDNIYDTADGMKSNKVTYNLDNQACDVVIGKDQESTHSELDHYHSIGSLERDIKPPYTGNSAEVKFQTDNECSKIDVQDSINGEKNYINKDDSISTDESETSCEDKDKNSQKSTHETSMDEGADKERPTNDDDGVRSQASSTNIEGSDENIYAKPNKVWRQRSSDKTEVSLIQGEVIIEASGVSVPVTTAPGSSTVSFESTSPLNKERPTASHDVLEVKEDETSIMKSVDKSMLMSENAVETDGANKQWNDANDAVDRESVSDIPEPEPNPSGKNDAYSSQTDANETNNIPNMSYNKTDHENNSDMTENDQNGDRVKKMYSVSSSCSDASKSTVDDVTISNFENVLASLVHSQRKSSGSSLSNISDIPEDRDASDPSIEDVHL